MNKIGGATVKKALLTTLLFFSFFLVCAGLRFAMGSSSRDGLRLACDDVLKGWSITAPSTGDPVIIENAGWNYLRAFEAISKKRVVGTVFAVRITGDSGPVTGVFYWNRDTGTSFCGLAGMPEVAPARCGITPRVSGYWIRSIDRLCEGREAKR
jgi:hypothetical protein